jgi:GAF domain-containing protein
MDDTPVSSTVSSGIAREKSASARDSSAQGAEGGTQPDTAAGGLSPARHSSTRANPFEPTSEEEELAVDSGWDAMRTGRALPHAEDESEAHAQRTGAGSSTPRLELAEPVPPRLLYEKAQDPSNDSPILYCERAYVVDGLQSDEELAEHLLTELGTIQESWRDRDSSQFVQLAAFDHEYQTEPQFPPLATLSWKDWQGRTELWVRGVRRSGPPSTVEGLDELDVPAREADRQDASNQLRSETAELRPLTEDEATPLVTPLLSERARSGDSGMSWQSPSRSGEYAIPIAEAEAEAPPPSSQRVLAGEDLMGALFERMNELTYLPDLPAGSAYVLETLEEFIPCSGIAIHVLDGAACEYVLVRALGPRAAEQIGQRQPDLDSLPGAAALEQRTLRVDGSHAGIWPALGLDIAHALCAPVQQRGHVFGAIELGRSASEGEFSDSQLQALDFISEQFAEFLSERPFQAQQL